MQVKIEGEFIYFSSNPTTAARLDAIFVKSRNAYRLPYTLGALRELYKAGYDVAELGKQKAFEHKALTYKKTANIVPIFDDRLRAYQLQDIHFLRSTEHCGIFNEQRTGKSVTVLKLFESEGRKKNLIVCPASLVLNWANEIRKFTDKTPFPVMGTKTKRTKIYNEFKEANEGYLIISKDTLRSDINEIEKL